MYYAEMSKFSRTILGLGKKDGGNSKSKYNKCSRFWEGYPKGEVDSSRKSFSEFIMLCLEWDNPRPMDNQTSTLPLHY